jgi:putative IMPACT (imprinted ancient) family translation regulator
VSDEESVKTRIADLKKKYYDARHYCYAYIMGFEGDNYRANDDGEPGILPAILFSDRSDQMS